MNKTHIEFVNRLAAELEAQIQKDPSYAEWFRSFETTPFQEARRLTHKARQKDAGLSSKDISIRKTCEHFGIEFNVNAISKFLCKEDDENDTAAN